jgi:hypothetical protein
MRVNDYALATPAAGDKLFGSNAAGAQKQFRIEDFTSQVSNKLSSVGLEFFDPVISHTGDTNERLLHSFKIPANYFSVGDMITDSNFSLNVKLDQATGGAALKMYFNTIDSLTGAQLIQTEIASSSGINNYNVGFYSSGYFLSNINFRAVNTDTLPVVYNNITFPDISNDFYVLYSVELNSSSDVVDAYLSVGIFPFKPY